MLATVQKRKLAAVRYYVCILSALMRVLLVAPVVREILVVPGVRLPVLCNCETAVQRIVLFKFTRSIHIICVRQEPCAKKYTTNVYVLYIGEIQ